MEYIQHIATRPFAVVIDLADTSQQLNRSVKSRSTVAPPDISPTKSPVSKPASGRISYNTVPLVLNPLIYISDGMWRVSALSWCTLVSSLSDDPMKTQPMIYI